MRYTLLGELSNDRSTVEDILINRGIPAEDIPRYLNTTDDDINDFMLLGEERLAAAYKALKDCVFNNKNCLIVVDSDCDGYTSAALMANYLYDLSGDWVLDHLKFFMHKGKQHGLSDLDFDALEDISLVICPDAGSNDYEEHKRLHDMGIPVIVLDHHEAEIPFNYKYAIIINNNALYEQEDGSYE